MDFGTPEESETKPVILDKWEGEDEEEDVKVKDGPSGQTAPGTGSSAWGRNCWSRWLGHSTGCPLHHVYLVGVGCVSGCGGNNQPGGKCQHSPWSYVHVMCSPRLPKLPILASIIGFRFLFGLILGNICLVNFWPNTHKCSWFLSWV